RADDVPLSPTATRGGGPPGGERPGWAAQPPRHALARDFRRIDPRRARIILIEAGPRILPAFPASLSDYALAAVTRLGVTVMTGQPVDAVDAHSVTVGGKRIVAGTIVWGAGIKASPAGQWLGIGLDRARPTPVA